MNKLLTANIFRLFENKLFWIAVIFMAAVGAGFPLYESSFYGQKRLSSAY